MRRAIAVTLRKSNAPPTARTISISRLLFSLSSPHHTDIRMAPWLWYAIAAALFYGAHQIFTRLASDHIGDGLGGFVVEATAALCILGYLGFLYFTGRYEQKFTPIGFWYSVVTGVCVGIGTVAFFLLFQKGGPLSALPVILAAGAALMALAGMLFFHEPPSLQRLLGIAFAIVGLLLLRS